MFLSLVAVEHVSTPFRVDTVRRLELGGCHGRTSGSGLLGLLGQPSHPFYPWGWAWLECDASNRETPKTDLGVRIDLSLMQTSRKRGTLKNTPR